MSTRVRTVVIAVAFGLLATISAAFYINSLRAEIIDSGTLIEVLVATENVAEGTPASALDAKRLVAVEEIPKQYVVDGALSSLDAYAGRVLADPLGRGEQLTAAKFRSAQKSEVSHKLPAGKIAISVAIDEVKGVGGKVQAGDSIFVLATFEPGPGGADISRVLLRDIKVLDAPSTPERSGVGAGALKPTITVAVTPSQAEKLVFAEEKGRVWIGLAPANSAGLPATGGQTMESVFK